MTPNVVTPIVENKNFIKFSSKVEEKHEKLFGKYNFLWFRFDHELKYFNIWYLAFFHLGALFGLLTFPYIQKWKLVIFTISYGSMAGFGVTGGVHRYFTHKSYKATKLMKIILLICYAAAGHNRIFEWVRDHRVHHKFSETDADPHNSNRGFFFSHIGWLMMKKHPDVIKKGATVDMSDIKNDPVVVWYDKNFSRIQFFFCFLLPTLLVRFWMGESWYWAILTQVFARYVIAINGTWLVNSAAHLFGRKPYDKSIQPRENLFVSFMSVGEGWHNYHHTFPWDYKASEYGRLNVTTFWLDLFAKFGLVYDRRSPSEELVKKVTAKCGDGTHKEYATYVTEEGEIRMIN
nr:acyl-CoA desaturase-like [Onthophagus taurus]